MANGTQPQTNKAVIILVIVTLAVNVTMVMSALVYCLVFKVQPDTTLLTAFVGIVNYILGVISGMLVKTSPTETTKQPLPSPPSNGFTSGGPPAEVKVVNEPANPVPTTEEKP